MQTRRLGRTGLEVPILSFGASSLGQEFRSVTLDEALLGYTEVAGDVLGRGDELGKLDVAYLADFLVMSADPRKVDVATVPDVVIREVWVGGARRF